MVGLVHEQLRRYGDGGDHHAPEGNRRKPSPREEYVCETAVGLGHEQTAPRTWNAQRQGSEPESEQRIGKTPDEADRSEMPGAAARR